MSYVVIIRGPLGVGKSTVAEKLTRVLGGEYIAVDRILSEANLDKVEEDIPIENFLKANKILIPRIKKVLESIKPVVLDGNFYYKEAIEDLEKNIDAKIFGFTLKAPVEVCIERDKNREKTHGELSARAVYSLVSKFDYGEVVQTEGKSIEQVAQEILDRIKKG